MKIYLPSFTDDELFQYADVYATTDLEKELLRRAVEARDAKAARGFDSRS